MIAAQDLKHSRGMQACGMHLPQELGTAVLISGGSSSEMAMKSSLGR